MVSKYTNHGTDILTTTLDSRLSALGRGAIYILSPNVLEKVSDSAGSGKGRAHS
jgi:hypothetical protein